MWFHAEGQEPDWFPPEVEGIANGKMKYHGYTEHYVNAHIEVNFSFFDLIMLITNTVDNKYTCSPTTLSRVFSYRLMRLSPK